MAAVNSNPSQSDGSFVFKEGGGLTLPSTVLVVANGHHAVSVRACLGKLWALDVSASLALEARLVVATATHYW